MRQIVHFLSRWLPVLVLAIGIAVQANGIVRADEDPQRGSGFAMYSSVDASTTRQVVASGFAESAVRLEIPAAFADEARRLAESPSDGGAREFAELLLDQQWTIEGFDGVVGGADDLTFVTVIVSSLKAEGRVLTSERLAEGLAERVDP